jgi:hypothetical protein
MFRVMVMRVKVDFLLRSIFRENPSEFGVLKVRKNRVVLNQFVLNRFEKTRKKQTGSKIFSFFSFLNNI